jgi:hypothetical protein
LKWGKEGRNGRNYANIIYVIDATVYFNVNIFNFLLFVWVQHFPYMCRSFTIYMPDMIKLRILLCPVKPPSQKKRVFKLHQLQSVNLVTALELKRI